MKQLFRIKPNKFTTVSMILPYFVLNLYVISPMVLKKKYKMYSLQKERQRNAEKRWVIQTERRWKKNSFTNRQTTDKIDQKLSVKMKILYFTLFTGVLIYFNRPRKIQAIMRVYFDRWTILKHFLKQNDKTEQISGKKNSIPIMIKMMTETVPITSEDFR